LPNWAMGVARVQMEDDLSDAQAALLGDKVLAELEMGCAARLPSGKRVEKRARPLQSQTM